MFHFPVFVQNYNICQYNFCPGSLYFGCSKNLRVDKNEAARRTTRWSKSNAARGRCHSIAFLALSFWTSYALHLLRSVSVKFNVENVQFLFGSMKETRKPFSRRPTARVLINYSEQVAKWRVHQNEHSQLKKQRVNLDRMTDTTENTTFLQTMRTVITNLSRLNCFHQVLITCIASTLLAKRASASAWCEHCLVIFSMYFWYIFFCDNENNKKLRWSNN